MSKLVTLWRRYSFHLLAVLLFIAIAVAYFFPADVEGRILYRHDSSAGRGANVEQQAYLAEHGERTRWTNALFSGMPTYQLSPSYDSTSFLSHVADVYHLFLPENVWYVFAYLVGFYILLLAFNVRRLLALMGALLWAFSSYFFIIIAAGHIWKVMALAYLPPLIAGVVYAYGRQRYLLAFFLITLFTALEIHANHLQMTYYFLFLILALILAYLCSALWQRQMTAWGKASAVCLLAALLGLGINSSDLYHTWQYSKESTRGTSSLTQSTLADGTTGSGIDRGYITQWSYGLGETWTLLIPNTKGGASQPLTSSATAMAHADNYYYPIYQQLGQYWGNQPSTSGPVYVGAVVLLLFFFALFVVKGPIKWALLAVTILSILLSWGRNFMPLTDFFIDYVPLYGKFRTVASILVLAECTIPLLAILGLNAVVADQSLLHKYRRALIGCFIVTTGLCVLFALFPTTFFPSFISSAEQRAMAGIPENILSPLVANLTDMRAAVFSADCWRSALLLTVGGVLILLFAKRRLSATMMVSILAVLCLADMWQVNKRYLHDSMFVARSNRDLPIPPSATDSAILEDKSLDYRVVNLASNTFNENETSYFHKSIGGYHAAKLRRYQDVIDRYLHDEMYALMDAIATTDGDIYTVPGDSLWPVLNALNTRYAIVPVQGPDGTLPLYNPFALGNAWAVDSVAVVANDDAALAGIGTVDLRRCALVDEKEQAHIAMPSAGVADTCSVLLLSYAPNALTYSFSSPAEAFVVFSEIYYPGWRATIDGDEQPLVRADYLLRGLSVPAGDHEITLTFRPSSLRATEGVAYASYSIAALILLVGIALPRLRQRKK